MEQLDPPVPLEHQELREPRARPAQPVHLEAADQPDHRERLEYQERLARQERPDRLEQAERLEQVVPVDHLEVLARQARAEARGATGHSGASGATGATGTSGATGSTGSSGAQGFFKDGTSILFGNCTGNVNDQPPQFLCEQVTVGRSFICLETTDVYMCLGSPDSTPRGYFGRSIVERLSSPAVRAPGDCTDLEPCWKFEGDMRRGFDSANHYLSWLIVLSVLLAVAFCLIAGLIVFVLINNRNTRDLVLKGRGGVAS